MDKLFEDFVRENLGKLDELAQRYGEYRTAATKAFIDDLRTLIRAKTPARYQYWEDKDSRTAVETIVGWFREFELSGIRATATVAFGWGYPTSRIAGGWLFKGGGGCWTGIKVYLPSGVRNKALAYAREIGIETERAEDNWLIWSVWAPLASTTVEGLHQRLVGEDRISTATEITEQLVLWTRDFESIVARFQEAEVSVTSND